MATVVMNNRLFVGFLSVFLGVVPATSLGLVAVLGFVLSLLSLFREITPAGMLMGILLGIWCLGGSLGYVGLIRSAFWRVGAVTVGLLSCGVLSMTVWAGILIWPNSAIENGGTVWDAETLWSVWGPIGVGCYHIVVYFRNDARRHSNHH